MYIYIYICSLVFSMLLLKFRNYKDDIKGIFENCFRTKGRKLQGGVAQEHRKLHLQTIDFQGQGASLEEFPRRVI